MSLALAGSVSPGPEARAWSCLLAQSPLRFMRGQTGTTPTAEVLVSAGKTQKLKQQISESPHGLQLGPLTLLHRNFLKHNFT